MVLTFVIALTTCSTGMTLERTPRLDFFGAVSASIDIFPGLRHWNRIISIHTHLSSLLRKLFGMTVGLPPAPQPIMNHLVGQSVADVMNAVLQLQEIARNLNDRAFYRKERESDIAGRDKAPRTGRESSIPSQSRGNEKPIKMALANLTKKIL